MPLELDAKDVKLIRELEKDGRAHVSSLARRAGVSKEVANYHIKKHLESGFIRKFYPLIDYFALGYSNYRLLVDMENFDQKIMDRIMRDFREAHNARFTVLLQSIRDLEIKFWVRHPSEFYDFYDRFLDRYSDHIQDKEFALVTRLYFTRHDYLHNSRGSMVLGRSKPQEVDKTDEKILELLKRDARMPTVDIAKGAGVSSPTAKSRMAVMKKSGVIRGFLPLLNTALLGYDNYKVRITLSNASRRRVLIQNLSRQPHVVRIAKFIGDYDIEAEVDYKSVMELENFLRRIRINNHSIKNIEVLAIARDWARLS